VIADARGAIAAGRVPSESYPRRTTILCAVLGVAGVLGSASTALGDDFSKARDKIDSIKPNIPYKSFCSETPAGEDKVACRIKSIPSTGFLVCKTHHLDGTACKDVIKTEISNLTQVKKAKLKTITFDDEILGPAQCADEASKDCYGYLVTWVTNGTFVNLDDTIHANGIAVLANDIIKGTQSGKVKTTKADINAIATFMAPGSGKYGRICDLQGFWLKSGGFLINDVPSVEIKSSSKPACGGAGMPSYDQALAGLEDLVKDLGK
jgi:hypothetical protein